MGRLLLVSSNPLFEEVILASIASCELTGIMSVAPGDVCKSMRHSKPNVVILDNTLEASVVEQILATARSMEIMRIILLNPNDNDFVVVDSHKSTMGKIEDLIQAIQLDKYKAG